MCGGGGEGSVGKKVTSFDILGGCICRTGFFVFLFYGVELISFTMAFIFSLCSLGWDLHLRLFSFFSFQRVFLQPECLHFPVVGQLAEEMLELLLDDSTFIKQMC